LRLSVVNDNDDMDNSEVLIELFDFNGSSLNKHQFFVDIVSNSSKELFSCEISSLLQEHSKNNVILDLSITLFLLCSCNKLLISQENNSFDELETISTKN
jgi:hypothetical protein